MKKRDNDKIKKSVQTSSACGIPYMNNMFGTVTLHIQSDSVTVCSFSAKKD